MSGLFGGLGHRQGIFPRNVLLVYRLSVILDQLHQFVIGVSGDLFPTWAIYYLGHLRPPLGADIGLGLAVIIHFWIWQILGK